MVNNQIIKAQGSLYQVKRRFPENRINLDKYEDSVTLLKQFYHCDTMFRAKGYLWLCNKIIDIGNNAEWGGGEVETNSKFEVDETVRKSDVVFTNEQWLYDIIWPYMEKANFNSGWRYNINSPRPKCELCKRYYRNYR